MSERKKKIPFARIQKHANKRSNFIPLKTRSMKKDRPIIIEIEPFASSLTSILSGSKRRYPIYLSIYG